MDESLSWGSHVTAQCQVKSRGLRAGRADGFTEFGSAAFPVCKDQQKELHKCWDQAQEWEEREELTLVSCLGNMVRAGQKNLAEVIKGSWMWGEKVSQEHGGVKEINTIISPATF